MLTKEQIAARKVGGSDVATILGLNPYKTAVELYHEARGTLPVADLSDNPNIAAGNLLEDGIADLAAFHMEKAWGRPVKLRRSNRTLVHPRYEWLTVHIDRDVVGEDRGVELKNVGARAAAAWGEPMTDAIPDYYVPQPHAYMLVLDYPVWTVAGYFGGGDLRLYEVRRSAEWDDIIVERTRAFWFDNVLAGRPPEIDFSAKDAIRVVRRLYPGTDGRTVQSTADEEHWLHVWREAKKKVAQYEAVADGALAHLEAQMEGAAEMEFFNGDKLVRKEIARKGYVVEPVKFMQTRLVKGKE